MVRAHGAAKRNFRRQEECRQQARQAPQDGLGWVLGSLPTPVAGASLTAAHGTKYQSWRLRVRRQGRVYATIRGKPLFAGNQLKPADFSNFCVPQPCPSQCSAISRSHIMPVIFDPAQLRLGALDVGLSCGVVSSLCFARSTRSRTRKYWLASSSLCSQCITVSRYKDLILAERLESTRSSSGDS